MVRDVKKGDFVKFIPQILIDELYFKIDLSGSKPNDHIFTRHGFLGEWQANETTRRDALGKQFKPIKDHYKLDPEYTWYSFHHSAIGNMFDNKVKELRKQVSRVT